MNKKIIALHGLIGSGKDAVTEFIQMHMHNIDMCNLNSINLDAYAFDAAFEETIDMMHHNQQSNTRTKKFYIERFATPLKQCIAGFLGISINDLYGQDIKKRELESEIYYDSYGNTCDIRDLHLLISDAIKTKLNPDIFAKSCIQRCIENPHNYILVNDLRYECELDALIDVNAYLVKIQRPDIERNIKQKQHQILHDSESGLDSSKFDFVIRNDSTLVDLSIKVCDMLLDAGYISTAYVKSYKKYCQNKK